MKISDNAMVLIALGILCLCFVAILIGLRIGQSLDESFPCEEDEALYTVSGLHLDYPDGDVECVNIEELFNYE